MDFDLEILELAVLVAVVAAVALEAVHRTLAMFAACRDAFVDTFAAAVAVAST
jgi:hypothetical protein